MTTTSSSTRKKNGWPSDAPCWKRRWWTRKRYGKWTTTSSMLKICCKNKHKKWWPWPKRIIYSAKKPSSSLKLIPSRRKRSMSSMSTYIDLIRRVSWLPSWDAQSNSCTKCAWIRPHSPNRSYGSTLTLPDLQNESCNCWDGSSPFYSWLPSPVSFT